MIAPAGRIFTLLVAARVAAASSPRWSRATSAIRGRKWADEAVA